MAVDSSILNYIKDYTPDLSKQYKYIEDTNWSYETSRNTRIQEHKVHYALVSKSLLMLQEFYSISKDYLNDNRVKAFTELLASFPKLYIKRQVVYFEIENWFDYGNKIDKTTCTEEEIVEVNKNKKEEIEFQSEILQNCHKFKGILKQLDLEGKVSEIDIPVFGDSYISIPMASKIEEKYPKVVTHIEQKE